MSAAWVTFADGPRGAGFFDRAGGRVWPTVARQVFRYRVVDVVAVPSSTESVIAWVVRGAVGCETALRRISAASARCRSQRRWLRGGGR